MRGAVVARVIPVPLRDIPSWSSSGYPQGHPFKSGRVHQSNDSWKLVLLLVVLDEEEAYLLSTYL